MGDSRRNSHDHAQSYPIRQERLCNRFQSRSGSLERNQLAGEPLFCLWNQWTDGWYRGCRPDGAGADGGADGRKHLRTICNCSSGDWGCQSQRSAGYHHGLRPWCTDHDDHRKWRKPLRDRRLYAPDCDRGAHCSCGLDRPDSKRENGIINHGHGSRALCACRPVCPVLKVMLKLGIRAIAPSQKAALRLGEPGEVAEAVVWLCSDAASFTTGHAMVIDGDTSQNRRHDRARPHVQGNQSHQRSPKNSLRPSVELGSRINQNIFVFIRGCLKTWLSSFEPEEHENEVQIFVRGHNIQPEPYK